MTSLCSTTTVSAYLLEGLPGATVESEDGIVLLKKKIAFVNSSCDSIVALIVATRYTRQTQQRKQTHGKQFLREDAREWTDNKSTQR